MSAVVLRVPEGALLEGREYVAALDSTTHWGVVVSDDGALMVLGSWAEMLDLGGFLGLAAPWAVGLVGLVMVPWALRTALRAMRWRRVIGEPHCVRCNYHLAGLAAGAACPECGKRGRVVGTRRVGRIVRPVLGTLLVVGALAEVAAEAHVWAQSRGSASVPLPWMTARVERVLGLFGHTIPSSAMRNFAWLEGRDLRTHKRLWRRFVTQGGAIAAVRGRSARPEVVAQVDRLDLVRLDMRTGRVVARVKIPEHADVRPWSLTSIHGVAATSDGSGVLVQVDLDVTRDRAVFRWDGRRGAELDLVCTLPQPPRDRNDRVTHVYWIGASGAHGVLVASWQLSAWNDGVPWTLSRATLLARTEVLRLPFAEAGVVASRDGSVFLLSQWGTVSVVREEEGRWWQAATWRLADASPAAPVFQQDVYPPRFLKSPRRAYGPSALAMSASGAWGVLRVGPAAGGVELWVVNVASGDVVARLDVHPQVKATAVSIGATQTHATVVALGLEWRTGSFFTKRVFVWTDIPLAPGGAAPQISEVP